MPSSSFTCVKPSDLDAIGNAAKAYRKMSDVKVLTQAATKAGEQLKTSMQQTIKGEPSLSGYHDVADALSVWEADKTHNVHVGIPESHALYGRAQEMHDIYPVSDVVMDLARQQDDIQDTFNNALAEAVALGRVRQFLQSWRQAVGRWRTR